MAVGKPEIVTQKRVINLFQHELGYRYLGDWTDRAGNSNIEEVLLKDHLQKNDFAIAEEVTLKGGHERRPDIVLYVNGIAVGVLELKKSSVSVGDGIRQNLSNQLSEFNEWFFSTVQFVYAGNDTEGLQYGTIGTGG